MSSSVSEPPELADLSRARGTLSTVARKGAAVHAVLLYGPEGAGKGALARELAQAWMCPESSEDGVACGECRTCKAVEADKAIDLQSVAPRGPSWIIKLSALREQPDDKDPHPNIPFLEFFRTAPMMAKRKVALVHEVHRMGPSTSNAFLKALEEPAPYVRIVMTTSAFSQVLPTIRSRCMCVACDLPDEKSIALALGGLSSIESVFGDSPGSVVHIREHSVHFEELLALLDGCRSAPFGKALLLAERCRAIAERYASDAGLPNRNANAEIVKAVGRWAVNRIPERHRFLGAVAESHRLIRGNAQAALVYETLFLRLMNEIAEL